MGIFDILGICIVYAYRLAPNLLFINDFTEHTHNSRAGRTVFVFLVFGIEDCSEISVFVNNADITVTQHSGCFWQQFFGAVNTKTFILIVGVIIHQLAIVIFYRRNRTGGVEFGSWCVLCRNTLFVHYTVGAIRQITIFIHDVVNLAVVNFKIDNCGKAHCYRTCYLLIVFLIVIRYPNGVCVCTVHVRGVGVLIKTVFRGNTEDIIISILRPYNSRGAIVCCYLYSILIITCCFSVYNCVVVGFAGINCIQTICELNELHRQAFCTGISIVCFLCGKLLSLLGVCDIEIAIVLKEGIGGIAVSVIVYDYGGAPFAVIPLGVAKLYAVVLIIIVINSGSKIDFVICSAKVNDCSIFCTVRGIHVILVSQIHSGFSCHHICGISFGFFFGSYAAGPNFKLFLVPQYFNICTKFA